MKRKKAHAAWRRLLTVILAVAMAVSWSPGGVKVHAQPTEENPADNSIINWDGLPEITEEKVTTHTSPEDGSEGVEVVFTHPGIFAKKDNFDLMRQMIHEGYDPWFSAFEAFREQSIASKEYENTNKDRTHSYIGNSDRQDANAAYVQSVMWWVTGDKDYFDIAVDIVRSYSESYDAEKFKTEQDGGYGWSADIITAGMVLNKLTFAAELLRYASPSVNYENGWTEEDTRKYTELLKMAYPLYDRTDKWMNQTAFTFQAMIASAVFQSDPDMYEMVIERATVNSKAAFHFADASIKWQARLTDVTVDLDALDNGELKLVNVPENEQQIQWAEMGRDQPHALAGLSITCGIAQTAYVQGTKINENGQIVNTGGTDLFEFLDDRLLKGANYYYKYNLGYEVKWYPIAHGNSSNYEDCPGISGSDNSPGWWTTISHGGRFRLGGSGVLYYHYNMFQDSSNPEYKYVAEAQAMADDTSGEGDAITNASLLIAPASAKTGEAQGPPQKKDKPGYETNTAGSGRIQAMSHTGAYAGRMADQYTPSSEYYTDEVGTRKVTNNNYADDYLWFKDYDLGTTDLDTFILTSASNSAEGTLFKVVLLDNVEVADWTKLTREEIDAGEVVVEGWSGATGWWSTYKTKTFKMTKPLSGKHSFAFLYLGSNNVYKLAANVDWMAFGNYYAYQDNLVKDAPIQDNVTAEGDYAVLKNGSGFGWDSMDMDVGNSALKLNIISTGTGKLMLYEGTPGSGKLVATYNVPYTGGKEMTVSLQGADVSTIKGNRDVYYVYEGNTDLKISTICSYFHRESVVPPVQGEDYEVVSGTVTTGKDGDTEYASFQDGAIAFYRLDMSKDAISFRMRTNSEVLLTLTSDMKNDENMSLEEVYRNFGMFKMEIPNTNGQWAHFQYDLTQVSNRSSNVYLMVSGGAADIDYIESGQKNTPPEIVSFAYSQPVFSMEKDGVSADYLLAGTDYEVTLETFDFDNDPVATKVTLDKDYSGTGGKISFNISAPGEIRGLLIADDGHTWTVEKHNLVVCGSLDELIEKVGAYDSSQTYSKPSMRQYENALKAAKEAAAGGYTQDMIEALEGLKAAAEALVMLVPSREDGEIDYIEYAQYLKFSRYSDLQGGYSEDQEAILQDIRSLTDGNAGTFIEWRHKQHNTEAYFVIDFKEGMGLKLDHYTLQSRQGFGSRTNGVRMDASNDGTNWVTISDGAANTDDLQTIDIKAEYADVPYRYIKLYNPRKGESGANSFMSIAEFHIYGQVVEMDSLLSFQMDGITFKQQAGTNVFAAEMGEAFFEKSGKKPVFTLLGDNVLCQNGNVLESGVSSVAFEGTGTGKGAKRSAVLTTKSADGIEQEYVIEITFNSVKLEEPQSLSWNGMNASFRTPAEENITGYEMALYKDDVLVDGTEKYLEKNGTGTQSVYYGPYMQESGNYTFKVKAKAQEGSEDFLDSEIAVSPAKAYQPAEIQKGKLIASFDFENLDAGTEEITGGGAKAVVQGIAVSADSYEGSGKAASISSSFWLNVTKEDGTPLLKGMKEITISYDNKWGANGNTGWTFYAAPNTNAQAGRYEKYLGILDRSGLLMAERYFLNNQGRPGSPSINNAPSDWKHVDVVVTKENTTIYVDGEQRASVDSGVQLTDILTAEGGILQIGKANWGSGEYYNGLIDNFQIYCNDAPGAVEVTNAKALIEKMFKAEGEDAITAAQKEAETIEAEIGRASCRERV